MIDIEKYNHLTRQIIGAAMEVHRILGCGFLESVYQKAMEEELRIRNIPFQSHFQLLVKYKSIDAGIFVPDLFVYNSIIVELKAQVNINYDQVKMQIINYLVASKLEISLMLNFGKPSLEFKRYVTPLKFQHPTTD